MKYPSLTVASKTIGIYRCGPGDGGGRVHKGALICFKVCVCALIVHVDMTSLSQGHEQGRKGRTILMS